MSTTCGRTAGILLLIAFVASLGLLAVPIDPAAKFDLWRTLAWAINTLAFLALLTILGIWLKGYPTGLLIDQRNRYSLSRLQMTAWTALAVPAIAVALGNNALRTPEIAAFPELVLDWTLVTLMGISLGSFVSAPLALSVKTQNNPDPVQADASREQLAKTEQVQGESIRLRGSLIVKAAPADARLRDFFSGEEVGNAQTVDIARIQMLAITTVVWATYAVMLFRIFSLGGAEGRIIHQFPAFDNTLLALIAVSHAGYIVGKVTPKTPQQSQAATRNLARTLSLLGDAGDIGGQIDTSVLVDHVTASEEQQLKRLREQINQIQANAEKARTDLTSGQDVGETIATLEGQLAAVKGAFRSVVSDRKITADADEPGPDLIRAVKQGLGKALGKPLAAGDSWSDSDEQMLQAYLSKLGLTRATLHPARYRAFEEVLGLLKG